VVGKSRHFGPPSSTPWEKRSYGYSVVAEMRPGTPLMTSSARRARWGDGELVSRTAAELRPGGAEGAALGRRPAGRRRNVLTDPGVAYPRRFRTSPDRSLLLGRPNRPHNRRRPTLTGRFLLHPPGGAAYPAPHRPRPPWTGRLPPFGRIPAASSPTGLPPIRPAGRVPLRPVPKDRHQGRGRRSRWSRPISGGMLGRPGEEEESEKPAHWPGQLFSFCGGGVGGRVGGGGGGWLGGWVVGE